LRNAFFFQERNDPCSSIGVRTMTVDVCPTNCRTRRAKTHARDGRRSAEVCFGFVR
jgi:hypothetical protein